MFRFIFVVSLLSVFTWPASVRAEKPQVPQLSAIQQQELEAGKLIFITHKPETGPSIVTGLAEIRVSAERLWGLLLDTNEIKRASKSVKELRTYIDEVDADGVRIIGLNYLIKSGPISLRYFVKRRYVARDGYMTWMLDVEHESDLAQTTGSYSTHVSERPGRVLFLYRASVDVGKNVPAWIEERLAAKSLKSYLQHIKELAETGSTSD
jgi:hypothetical protein